MIGIRHDQCQRPGRPHLFRGAIARHQSHLRGGARGGCRTTFRGRPGYYHGRQWQARNPPAESASQAPEGWIQDKEGLSTTDPHALKNGGALLPLGGDREHGSHKGYALGAIVDIFSAVLSGANYGPWVPPFPAYVPMPTGMPGKGIGHFLGAMRIDAFRPADEFKHHMDKWIGRFRSAKPVPGQERVLIPGDPEREMEVVRRQSGIPLSEAVVADLKGLADKLGVAFPGGK